MDGAEETKIFALIDSNWLGRQFNLLRSPLGIAFLHHLERAGGRLLVPEVIEVEVRRHWVGWAAEALDTVKRNIEAVTNILADVGGLSSILVPKNEAADEAFTARMAALAPIVRREPYRDEDGRRAYQLVRECLPPNSQKDQQYKDSLIWAVALRASLEAPVLLVTKDKGFYQGRDYSKKLAGPLVAMHAAQEPSHPITIYDELSDATKVLQADAPSLDLKDFRSELLDAVRRVIPVMVGGGGIEVGAPTEWRESAFLVPRPDVIAVVILATFEALIRVDGESPVNGSVEIACSLNLSTRTRTTSDAAIQSLIARDEQGKQTIQLIGWKGRPLLGSKMWRINHEPKIAFSSHGDAD